MKVWVSCYQWKTVGCVPDIIFVLHTNKAVWEPSDAFVGGGRWCSREGRGRTICEKDVRRILGERTPEIGELLEIPIKPGTTWVMK